MRLTFTCCLLLTAVICMAQNVGIGTTSPNSSAQLDVSSGSRGILIPRMTSTVVSGIVNPAKGLMVYDSTRNQLLVNMGSPAAPDWENIIANSGWGLSGNPVSADGSFIGTTTLFPLRFAVNNLPAGLVDPSFGNTLLGYGAVSPADPAATLNQATTGVGFQVLANNEGMSNSGLGYLALASNTTGDINTAVGALALRTNLNGYNNSAFGFAALIENSSGTDNTGLGFQALGSNQAGFCNTAVGSRTLQETTNSSFNTAVGFSAGFGFDNGYNNVFVGANTDVNGAGYYNVIAMGQGTICTASSQARFGNSATNSIGGYANWTNFSDGRYKKNMKEDVVGLDFIMRLRPLTYNLDVSGIQAHLGKSAARSVPAAAGAAANSAPRAAVSNGRHNNTPPAKGASPAPAPVDPHMQQAMAERETEVLSGFSAQEVEKAALASGYAFSGVDKPKNDNDFYGLRYGDFVVPLVKAVQEQQQMIRRLQEKLDQQASQIKQQATQLKQQAGQIKQLLNKN